MTLHPMVDPYATLAAVLIDHFETSVRTDGERAVLSEELLERVLATLRAFLYNTERSARKNAVLEMLHKHDPMMFDRRYGVLGFDAAHTAGN